LVDFGNTGILCKVQEKEGNEGRKTDNHEEWTQCYIRNMLGLRYQDVQDRQRKRKSQSKEGRRKGKAKEGQESRDKAQAMIPALD
jgi:hypothetical protein